MKYTIGEVIRRERNKQGITQEELAYGICSTAWLSQIESGACTPTIGKFEKLMNKLGKSASQYIYYKSEKELEIDNLKIEFRRNYYVKELKEARENLEKLKAVVPSEDELSKQFIILYDTILNKADIDKQEVLKLLYRSVNITIPNFDIDNIENYLLTQDEIVIIINIALSLRQMDKKKEAVSILIKLKKYIESPKFDYEEKLKSYPVILYNLSKWQGLDDQQLECIATAQIGIDFCIKHDIASMLANLLFNKGYALLQIESKMAALTCIRQAYYIFLATKQEASARAIKEYIEQYFDDTTE